MLPSIAGSCGDPKGTFADGESETRVGVEAFLEQ